MHQFIDAEWCQQELWAYRKRIFLSKPGIYAACTILTVPCHFNEDFSLFISVKYKHIFDMSLHPALMTLLWTKKVCFISDCYCDLTRGMGSKEKQRLCGKHYNDVIMSAMASQITSLTIFYSIVYSGTDQRKHQTSASLAFVRGIHWWLVNSPHKGPVMRKMFPSDDVIMEI